MNARKRLFTFLFAALSVLLFTACGKWDYSREAMKAANEAQGDTLRVEFKVNQTFTNALRAAAEDNIQPADVDKAMTMDKSIEKLLTSGYRLDVYALRADTGADQAAAQLADEFVNRLAGCEDEGYISMVKAENGYFYEAVLVYKHDSGSSGGGNGSSGENEPYIVKVTAQMDKVYFEGDNFNPDDVDVAVYWSDSKQPKTVSLNDCSYNIVGQVDNAPIDGESLEAGKYQIEDITYRGKTSNDKPKFDVYTLAPTEILSVTGYDKTYKVGTSIDLNKLKVEVKLNNNQTTDWDADDFTIEPSVFSAVGDEVEVTITYKEPEDLGSKVDSHTFSVKVENYTRDEIQTSVEKAAKAAVGKFNLSNVHIGKDILIQNPLDRAIKADQSSEALAAVLKTSLLKEDGKGTIEVLGDNDSSFVKVSADAEGQFYCVGVLTFPMDDSPAGKLDATPNDISKAVYLSIKELMDSDNPKYFLGEGEDTGYKNDYNVYVSVSEIDNYGTVSCAVLLVRNRVKVS